MPAHQAGTRVAVELAVAEPDGCPHTIDQALEWVLTDPVRAIAAADRVHAAVGPQGDEALAAQALLVRALACLRAGDEAGSHAALTQADRLPACASDPRSAGLRQHMQAQLLRLEGYNEAARSVLAALHGHAEGRPTIDAFHTVITLGIVQGMLDRIDESLASFYAALDLARSIGSLPLEVNALNNLGAQQLDLHNLDDALPMLRQSLSGALRLESRRLEIFAAGNLVQCLCAMGQAGEALALARQHLIPVIRGDDPPSLHRDEEIANALMDNGLHDEAAAYLRREARTDVLTNPTAATRAWLQARLLLAEDQPREALELCLSLWHLMDDDSVMPADRLRLCEFTAELAAQCDEHRTAYVWLRRAHGLKEQLLGRAARARFVSLQIDHDLRGARRERDTAQAAAHQQAMANAALQQQIAANEALQGRLRALALEDPLTGLGNRRQLMQWGAELIEQARGTGQTVAVALCDMDHFKRINDQHGHDAGDQVLMAFAGLARLALRPNDLCCRLGGEEFAVLMPGATEEVAARRLQALLAEFTKLPFVGAAGAAFAASFSAGVCECGVAGENLPLQALLARADQRLYSAKEAGRSRVCARTPPEAPGAAADYIESASIAR